MSRRYRSVRSSTDHTSRQTNTGRKTSGRAPSTWSDKGSAGSKTAQGPSGGGIASLGVQPKLQINTPGDRYEQEADAVANAVTSGDPAPAISKLPSGGLTGGASGAPTAGSAQRQEGDEEAEPVQMQAEEEELVQMQDEEEEPIQMQEEEEEPLQMQEVEGEEEPTQRQEDEGEEVQMQEEEEEAQAKEAPGAGGGRSAAAAATASRAMRQAGAGSPLPSPVRSQIESSTGRDFSGVRVHDGDAAQSAASAINAKAFTRGSDIYLGQGASPTDTQLMAHEATHVVQQSAAPPSTAPAQREPAQRDVVQRQEIEDEPVQRADEEEPVQRDNEDGSSQGGGGGESGGAPAGVTPSSDGTREGSRYRLHFDTIEIPAFKTRAHRGTLYDEKKPLVRKKSYNRGTTGQRTVWQDNVSKEGIVSELDKKKQDAFEGFENQIGGSQLLFRTYLSGGYVMGSSTADIAPQLVIPTWGQSERGEGGSLEARIGNTDRFDVDHIVELQLSGWNGRQQQPAWANQKGNMELLRHSPNSSSGSRIRSSVEDKARQYSGKVRRETPDSVYTDHEKVLRDFDLIFHNYTAGGDVAVGMADYWTRGEIEQGKHLLHPESVRPIPAADAVGENRVLILSSAGGTTGKQFRIQEDGNVHRDDRNWLEPFETVGASFSVQENANEREPNLGQLTVKVPAGMKGFESHANEEVSLTVHRLGTAQFIGYLEKADVKNLVEQKLGIRGTSPVRVVELFVDPETGLVMHGKLLPTVPLIGDADIDVILRGGDLSISKTFQVGDYNFPGPIAVTQSNLTLAVGTERGLSISGRAEVEVENVGTGHIEGGASTEEGFHVEGGFEFDTELFSEASITLGYDKAPDEEAVFSGSGRLSIGRDKVAGIRSASINVTVENESWTADGRVEPEINGIREGTLTAAYAPETGFAIDGSLTLSEDVPGIRGGTLQAGIRQRESGEGYKVHASGEADLDIPGVTSKIGVTYDDGLFTAQTTVGYERGMLSGQLTAGVTNVPLGDDGRPQGGEGAADPGVELRAFGGGELTLALTPWLEATAGVQLLPNGEVELRGEIGLPSTIELFPERRYERRIFQIGIDIPILGVAFAGQRIGIFATVSGGLDAIATVGPGELRDARLSVQYNPDREQDTTVTGHALFVIPAFAGLRLFVRGGLGVGIPIVSAEAGLEVGGQLGLEGSAEAEADVNWNPQAGLVLHAEGRIFAEPSFVFDVSGYVNVSADLLLTTIDLYDERFRLASYEWGSGMRVGVIFPVDYREGEPFSLSTDDIQFVYPQISPRAIMSDLVDEVV